MKVSIKILFAALAVAALALFALDALRGGALLTFVQKTSTPDASDPAIVPSPFHYEFKIDGIVEETGSMAASASPYWWVNSGARLILSGGAGKTVHGELPAYSKWRLAYSLSNPADTDNGYHPQNIFRLVSRHKWQNYAQEAYFRVDKHNASSSSNRDVSNGLLLFNRYQDGDNLYYAGIRVDGNAIIKKKKGGTYYTLASNKVLPGAYDRANMPTLIPKETWIGLRSVVTNGSNGSVSIKLYMDNGKTGTWTLVAEATDDGKSYGGAAITAEGYGGIRTDFMDVSFDDYRMTKQ